MDNQITKTLSASISAASIAVGSFVADGKNKEQNYEYITADAVLTRAGDAMAKQGMAVIPSIEDIEIVLVERGAGKNPRIDARVKFEMHLSTSAGDNYNVQWFGLGSDYSTPDKAVYKAITSGHKYFLMKLLNIGIGNDDSEHDTEDPAKPEPKTAKPIDYSSLPDPIRLMTNDKGILYTDLTSDQLGYMANAMMKKLKENGLPEDEKSRLGAKLESAKAIIAVRNG